MKIRQVATFPPACRCAPECRLWCEPRQNRTRRPQMPANKWTWLACARTRTALDSAPARTRPSTSLASARCSYVVKPIKSQIDTSKSIPTRTHHVGENGLGLLSHDRHIECGFQARLVEAWKRSSFAGFV